MQPNFLDQERDRIVTAIENADSAVRDLARGMSPYGADQLTDAEEDFLFDNMAVAYEKEFPGISNADAMKMYRTDVGDEEFVKFYERVYKRRTSGVAG